MSRSINVLSVKVPNPMAMKFEVEDLLLTPGAYTFATPEEAKRSPLAAKLFGFDYVQQVFIAKNFVTVTKKEELPPWDTLLIDIRIIIKKHLEAEELLFTFDGSLPEPLPEGEGYLVEKIRETLERQILPATWTDGGEIYFESFVDGVVKVRLAGSCVGCPFAPRTLKAGVEVLLKRHFPDVVSVTSDDVDWGETQQEINPEFEA
jgi:NFU1 iron-sulfur cluster scaffold homolog, mitochondrial